MTVYFAPSNRYNLWTGGSGRTGILDLIGQALIQPMLQRDAAARQYRYDSRLADEEARRKHELDLATKNAEWNREDHLINEHDRYVRENPSAIPGTGGATATFLALGGKGDLAQYQPYLLPQSQSIDLGGQVQTRAWNPDGTVAEGATYNKTLSPLEAGTLALSTRAAELEEWKARQAAALEREKARRGTGPALVPLQGYTNDAGNPLLYNQYTGVTVPLYGAKPVQQQPNMAQTALTASEIVKNIFPSGGADGSYGVQLGETGAAGDRVSVFRELLSAFGGGGAPAPAFPGYGGEFDDSAAFGRALSNMNTGGGGGVAPQPAATQPQSDGAPSFQKRLRDRRHGDAPVAVPGTPQASVKKPFVSAAAVANYAKQFGMSEEAARDELTRFNSM